MELYIQTIVQSVINSFTHYDEDLKRDMPSVHATLENVSFGIRDGFWGNGRDAMDPLRTITITYDMFVGNLDDLMYEHYNYETIISRIVDAFQEHHNSWLELFSIEMTSSVKARWKKGSYDYTISGQRCPKVITRDNVHQPKLVITYSEDSRLLDNWSPQKDA